MLRSRYTSHQFRIDRRSSVHAHRLSLSSDATDEPNIFELLDQDGEALCRVLQRQYLTSWKESSETLNRCAFAALIATLNAETRLLKRRLGLPLDRSQSLVTNETSSTLPFPALRLRALHDAVAPTPTSQLDARVPLPMCGNEYDTSEDLTAEIAGITEISEEEDRLCAQAWRFEQTFEARTEQHFGNRLVENERNVVERMRQEVGANHAKIECALEAAAANNVQLVAPGNIAFEQRYNALRQRVFEGYDGYRAHVAVEVQEDIPAYVEASIAEGRELFGMQFNKGDRRVEQHASEQFEMFEVAWFEQTYSELFYN